MLQVSARRFEFRYDSWFGPLQGLLGLGRSRSHVTVGDGVVEVRMGWGFRAIVPIASIVAVESTEQPGRWWWGWGVHGWRGRWLVNGSMRGLVSVTIDPPSPARTIGFPLQLRELVVSLEEPEAFVETIAAAQLR